jgi:hypothetical protein
MKFLRTLCSSPMQVAHEAIRDGVDVVHANQLGHAEPGDKNWPDYAKAVLLLEDNGIEVRGRVPVQVYSWQQYTAEAMA